MCGVGSWIIHPINCTTHAVTSGIINDIASAVQTAEADMIGALASLWTHVPTPTVGSTDTGQPVGAVAFLWTDTSWLVGAFAVLGLLIAAGKLAWQRRAEPAKAAFRGLFNLVVVSGCSVAVIELLTKAGDDFSEWILQQSLQTSASSDFGSAMKNLTVLSTSSMSLMLVIVMGLIAILSCIVQLMLMLVRFAMLGLLTGLLPVTASVSGTESGQAAFKKACGWLLAFVLYKPVAATIYAYAIVSMKQQGLTDVLSGLAMIIMSVVALPALMRFIVPAVSAVSGGGGGAGAALAGAGIATGARMLGQGAQSSSGGGGGGGSGGGGGDDSGPTGSNQTPTSSGGGQGQGQGGGGGGAPMGAEGGAEAAGAGGAGAGGAGAGAASGAGGGAAAGGAAGAGAAAGPAGIAVAAGAQAAQKIKGAAQGAVQHTTGEGS
ncbi:hypothetical protein ACFOSC_29700 [Streptantibioticus rubrisoli]|uniref:TrbL/VirB6 plasmid conjugal transfer protein n=1 Tax=Streptantibioticus rubrisoli TaxID=1387313 RepID=A0ABT1PJ59_9ACTN|nr:hypothetical protein [Streptantibioticus rubrisoli]MCQ4044278.1 hypothetical protein [Streptantibioticus rubrisoli]